jgi:hypothetical protein
VNYPPAALFGQGSASSGQRKPYPIIRVPREATDSGTLQVPTVITVLLKMSDFKRLVTHGAKVWGPKWRTVMAYRRQQKPGLIYPLEMIKKYRSLAAAQIDRTAFGVRAWVASWGDFQVNKVQGKQQNPFPRQNSGRYQKWLEPASSPLITITTASSQAKSQVCVCGIDVPLTSGVISRPVLERLCKLPNAGPNQSSQKTSDGGILHPRWRVVR